MPIIYLAIVCFIASFYSEHSPAGTFETNSIDVKNRSPFVMLFGLVTPELSRTLAPGTIRSNTQFEISNYLSKHISDDTIFFIDGETWILTQTAGFKWEDYQVSLSLPWLRHFEGKLDRSIYNFHDILSLPQNGRTDYANDRQLWYAQQGDDVLYSNNSSTTELGDVSINISKRLRAWQLKASLKLPTGTFEKQTGSEGLDAGFAVTQFNPTWLRDRSWLTQTPLSLWWGAGLTYLSKAKELEAFDQNSLVATFNTGMAWQASTHWQIKTQLDTHSPLFDSDIRELGWIPLLFSIAGQYRVSSDSLLTIAINEDLRPRVTPDVIFSFALATDF